MASWLAGCTESFRSLSIVERTNERTNVVQSGSDGWERREERADGGRERGGFFLRYRMSLNQPKTEMLPRVYSEETPIFLSYISIAPSSRKKEPAFIGGQESCSCIRFSLSLSLSLSLSRERERERERKKKERERE